MACIDRAGIGVRRSTLARPLALTHSGMALTGKLCAPSCVVWGKTLDLAAPRRALRADSVLRSDSVRTPLGRYGQAARKLSASWRSAKREDACESPAGE